MKERPNFRVRIGTFFLILGTILIILFIASVFSAALNLYYLIGSLIFLFLGYGFLKRRTLATSVRFGAIRRARERRKERQDQNDQSQQE